MLKAKLIYAQCCCVIDIFNHLLRIFCYLLIKMVELCTLTLTDIVYVYSTIYVD